MKLPRCWFGPGDGPRPAPGGWFDLLAVSLLVILALFLFRKHVLGQETYLGNPDRLHNHLKVLKFHTDGLDRGRLDAWCDSEMMGFDTFALPYTFPNPLTYLTWWMGAEYVYVTAGYVSIGLLALAGVAAYVFLRRLSHSLSPALIGAIAYEFSALTILKISQNDMSFAVFILAPLLALAVLTTSPRGTAYSFVLQGLLIFGLLQFTFLQKAAYVLLLVGCYAAYRTARQRDWRPLAVFGFAVLVGGIAAFPRVYGVGLALSQYVRRTPGVDLHNFQEFYRFQHIRSWQILRWFDDTLFGRFPSEVVDHKNSINLTEGMLLYTAAVAPFLVFLGLVRYRGRWFGLPRTGASDAGFFCWFFFFAVAVVVVKPVLYCVFLLFGKMDFTHARILVAGLLPLAVLITLLLEDLRPKMRAGLAANLAAWLLAGSILLGVEWAVRHWPTSWAPRTIAAEFVDRGAFGRIVLSGSLTLVLVALLRLGRLPAMGAVACHGALGLTLVGQVLLAADFRVNGPGGRPHSVPFSCGNNYRAARSALIPPVPLAVAALHRRLDPDRNRTILLCDERIAGGFGAGHIPGFWRLRAVDGYYGVGVPARLAVLPWPGGVNLRTLNFYTDKTLPWPLLGLLNVRYALNVDRGLYLNEADVGDVVTEPRILENPERVVPRCFFAQSIEPVASPDEAATRLFAAGKLLDVRGCSFVEGLAALPHLPTGSVSLRGHGDQLNAFFDPDSEDRFLVVNELYFLGWQAEVDGRPTAIYPTNAVMRGVLVPAGATSVALHYVPFVRSSSAVPFYVGGVLLFGVGFLVFGRFSRTDCPGGVSS